MWCHVGKLLVWLAALSIATATRPTIKSAADAPQQPIHVDHQLLVSKKASHQTAVVDAASRKSLSCIGNASGTAWIEEYTEWHAANLGKPGTKYMIAFCGEGDLIKHNGKQERYCAGMGDRFRGLMEVLRLAFYSKRVFLIYWGTPATPEPLQAMLLPSSIDWRVKPEYKLEAKLPHCVYMHVDVKSVPIPEPLATGSFREKDAHCPVLAISWNVNGNDHDMPGPPLGLLDSDARACVWRALFQPSSTLQSKLDAARKQLMGDVVRPYVAIHLRLGGLTGSEVWDLNRVNSSLKALLAVLQCASHLAVSYNMTTPILVLTDNAMLRHEVARARLAGIVGSHSEAKHIDKVNSGKGFLPDAINTTHTAFVDLGLLAGATCMLTTASGFNQVARLWGGHSCHLDSIHCASLVVPANEWLYHR